MPTGISVTIEQKEDLIAYYQTKPMTLKHISKCFNLSIPTVTKILNEYNINRYKKAIIFNPDLIEDYFDIINTECKAYYLGLIITDGNVFKTDKKQASISITQKSEDEYILKRFLEEVKSNTSIGHDGRGCSQVAVRSDIMASSLEKYGIKNNKTLKVYLPKVNDELMCHLIRGILDGDGNIKAKQTNIRNRFAHAISFCGTHQLMEDIGYYLLNKLNIKKPTVYDYKDRHLSEIKWQGKDDMYKIGEWLYGDATVFLQRKYNNYLYFKEHYNY